MNNKKIVFLGAGAMAEAIIRGLVDKKVIAPACIAMKNHSNTERLHTLQARYGTTIASAEDIATADIVVLAMKPKDIATVLQAHPLAPHTAVVSVLAGVTMATIEKYAGKRPVARLMPNTSATIGLSTSGATFNSAVSPSLQQDLIELFEAIGTVEIVTEEQMHAITALAGSGPAYMYYFIECYEKAGVALGLDAETARALMIDTMMGAAEMLKRTGEDPAVLRENITSYKGTTFEALEVLRKHDVARIIEESTKANADRSREFAKIYD